MTDSNHQQPIVVVGGGQAAVQLCLALRKEKVIRPVVMVSEENHYPYHRPPLSKSFLLGDTDADKLPMRPPSFYESKDILVELNTVVQSVQPQSRSISTEKGDINYHSLVLTTGASPINLPVAGSQLNGVHVLRNLEHSEAIKEALHRAQNIVVVGAGFIGLEFAAAAAKLGKSVKVFDLEERVMQRAVAPDISRWFAQMHKANGVELLMQDSVTEIKSSTSDEDAVGSVLTRSGHTLDCDLLVVGIGVRPNTALAEAAGLHCDNGIVVNEYCETSVEHIYAAGDCVSHPNPFSDRPLTRLESVQNATDQARVVASAIAGRPQPYCSVPWFWSDQAGHSLQITGLAGSADHFVTRKGADESSFSVFHYRGQKLLCVDSVNSPRDHMLARKLITAHINPTFEQAADADFALNSLFGNAE